MLQLGRLRSGRWVASRCICVREGKGQPALLCTVRVDVHLVCLLGSMPRHRSFCPVISASDSSKTLLIFFFLCLPSIMSGMMMTLFVMAVRLTASVSTYDSCRRSRPAAHVSELPAFAVLPVRSSSSELLASPWPGQDYASSR